jgi:hypothetical protein
MKLVYSGLWRAMWLEDILSTQMKIKLRFLIEMWRQNFCWNNSVSFLWCADFSRFSISLAGLQIFFIISHYIDLDSISIVA